jgi:ABC-2 type transport system ATP-binding protein
MTHAISIERLTKHYEVGFLRKRVVHALDDLTLTVEPGQVLGLLGPNGAGKSTTIKLLLNLIRPTSGRALLFGRAPADALARRDVGFLPENPAPYEYLTGAEFVSLAGALSGLSGAELKRRVGEVIAQVEMTRAAGLQIRKYSKGMIQRISFAQALVNQPKLLILDEPTSGLDVLGRQLVRDIIFSERRRGTTVLFCSHIISDVESLCDRVVVLLGGKLVREGKMSELLSSEQTLVELSLEAVSDACQAALAGHGASERIGERVVLRCEEAAVPRVLQAALQHGARVVSLQRTRYSLEDLFLAALKQSATTSVGSAIS